MARIQMINPDFSLDHAMSVSGLLDNDDLGTIPSQWS